MIYGEVENKSRQIRNLSWELQDGRGRGLSRILSRSLETPVLDENGEQAITVWPSKGRVKYSIKHIAPPEKLNLYLAANRGPGRLQNKGTCAGKYVLKKNKSFLNEAAIDSKQARIDTLLRKYCRFLPIPVYSGETLINALEPMWMKKPSELTDEDYIKFYHELYPGQDDPLFWIHLNVDYPFTLTGILYFPKIKNNFEVTKNRIQLYCNQVFVTDSVEGVVPEFMMLLQGRDRLSRHPPSMYHVHTCRAIRLSRRFRRI